MGNELLYGIGGLALGLGGMYLLIRQGIIPNPAPVVVARARVPMRARAVQPVAMNNNSVGKFSRQSFNGRIVAENVPTQFKRAGILASQQGWGQHSDLIRID